MLNSHLWQQSLLADKCTYDFVDPLFPQLVTKHTRVICSKKPQASINKNKAEAKAQCFIFYLYMLRIKYFIYINTYVLRDWKLRKQSSRLALKEWCVLGKNLLYWLWKWELLYANHFQAVGNRKTAVSIVLHFSWMILLRNTIVSLL